MPNYQYICAESGEEFEELFLTFKCVEREEADLACPKCGSKNKNRQMSVPGVTFKGTGWTSPTTGRNYDSTSGIKDQAKELQEQKRNLTSESLYGNI
jgi:putative FmdB family regulatory protein